MQLSQIVAFKASSPGISGCRTSLLRALACNVPDSRSTSTAQAQNDMATGGYMLVMHLQTDGFTCDVMIEGWNASGGYPISVLHLGISHARDARGNRILNPLNRRHAQTVLDHIPCIMIFTQSLTSRLQL
jgi:hypothetical protein